jgi:hypothetical protein
LKLPAINRKTCFTEKEKELVARFFLYASNLPLPIEPQKPVFEVSYLVIAEDILNFWKQAAKNKNPGSGRYSYKFLLICGKPLAKLVAKLAIACFKNSFLPKKLKEAIVIVLDKLGKTPEIYSTLAGYRPISLLPTLVKTITLILAKRVIEAAEKYSLLLIEQIGNRKNRSIELAIRLLAA